MITLLPLIAAVARAQEQTSAVPEMELTAEEKQFKESMTNVTLTGFFTVGESAESKEDKYTIERITKRKNDIWNFETRIRYGTRDYKTTVAVPVKWAGDTPVLTLSNYLIKGHGVFSARILVHHGMYAGTWGAKEHGGNMFGRIVKNEPLQ